MLINASVNVSHENETLCVKCVFMTNVTNRSCSVHVKNSSTYILKVETFQEPGTSTASACISELPAGTYSVCVCSTDCAMDNTTQLLFAYQNLTILGVGMFIEGTL